MDIETLQRLIAWRDRKLRQLKLTIEEVIEAVEKDDTTDLDILKTYNLNKRIILLDKVVNKKFDRTNKNEN